MAFSEIYYSTNQLYLHDAIENKLISEFEKAIHKNDMNYIKNNYKYFIENDLIVAMRELFFIACSCFETVDDIDFLYNVFNTNDMLINVLKLLFAMISHNSGDPQTSLIISARYNPNFEIFKYLVSKNPNELYRIDKHNMMCFHYILMTRSFEEIKYCIDELKIDINHCNDHRADFYYDLKYDSSKDDLIIESAEVRPTCLSFACLYNKFDVACYMLNKFKFWIQLTKINKEILNELIPNVKENYSGFNNLIEHVYYKTHSSKRDDLKHELKSILDSVNPLMIDDKMDYFKIKNNDDFNKFIANVDSLMCAIPFKTMYFKQKLNKNITIDFSKNELLFIGNGVEFRGCKKTMFESVLVLKQMSDDVKIDEELKFDFKLPVDIYNKYIYSWYSHVFELMTVPLKHIFEFLKLIDCYETEHISIIYLEHDIIQYIKFHKIIYNDHVENFHYLKQIAKKYKLMNLYIFINNQKFSE